MVSEKIGRRFSQTNAFVCNRRQLSCELLFKIAEALQVDVKELIDSKKRELTESNLKAILWN